MVSHSILIQQAINIFRLYIELEHELWWCQSLEGLPKRSLDKMWRDHMDNYHMFLMNVGSNIVGADEGLAH